MKKILIFILFSDLLWAGVRFDRGDNWINLGNHSEYFIAAPLTVGLRVKFDDVGTQYLFGIGYNSQDRFNIRTSEDSLLYVVDDINNNLFTRISANKLTGGVHTIVVTIHPTAGMKTYIDGEEDTGMASPLSTNGFDQIPVSGARVGINLRVNDLNDDRHDSDFLVIDFFIDDMVWTQDMISNYASSNLYLLPLKTSIIEYYVFDEFEHGTQLLGDVFHSRVNVGFTATVTDTLTQENSEMFSY